MPRSCTLSALFAGGHGIDFARLPMTQAGFIPGQFSASILFVSSWGAAKIPGIAASKIAKRYIGGEQIYPVLPVGAELLAQLQLLAPAANAAPLRGDVSTQQQGQQRQLSPQQAQEDPRRAQATVDTAARAEAEAALPMHQAAQRLLGSPMRVEQPNAAQAGAPASSHHTAASTAELLTQLRLSATAHPSLQPRQQQPAEQQRMPGLSTAELLEQLRASSTSLGVHSRGHQHEHMPGPSTEGLLKQLRASASLPTPAQQQQQLEQQQPPAQVHHDPGPSTAELLEQLRASCSGAPDTQQRRHDQARRMPGPPTAQLLEQLRASATGTALPRSGSVALLQMAYGSSYTQHGQAGQRPPAPAPAAQPAVPLPSPAGVLAEKSAQECQQERHAAPDMAALLAQLGASAQLFGSAQPAADVRSQQGEQHGGHGLEQHGAGRQALSTVVLLAWLQQAAGPRTGRAPDGCGQADSEDGASELARLLAAAHGEQTAPLPPQPAGNRAAVADNAQLLQPQLAQARRLPQPQPLQQQRVGSASHDPELPPAKYRLQDCGASQLAAAASAQHESVALPQTEVVHGSGSRALPAGSPASSAGSPPAAGGVVAGPVTLASDTPRLAAPEERSMELVAASSQVTWQQGGVGVGETFTVDLGVNLGATPGHARHLTLWAYLNCLPAGGRQRRQCVCVNAGSH